MPWQLVPPALANNCTPGTPDGDDGINLAECLRLNDDTPVYTRYDSVSTLVNLIVPNLFIIAGIVLFFMIVWGGYQYIMKGKKGVEEARNIWTRAGIGIIIMIAAYWIVQLIAYLTGADILIDRPW